MICGATEKNAVLNIGTTGIYKHKGLICTHLQDAFYNVRGSQHVYKNDGLHNADDMRLSDFVNTLNKGFDELGKNPDFSELSTFEFGVNIVPPVKSNHFISCIHLHKSKKGDKKEKSITFNYDQYAIKIYNKSAETEPEPYHSANILRIEIKSKEKGYLKNEMPYRKMSDLLDVELWKHFEELIVKAIEDCLIMDFTESEINRLSDKDRIKYGDYVNGEWWVKLHNSTKGYRTKYQRAETDCASFINQFSKSTLKNDVVKLIRIKCEELRDVEYANAIVKKWRTNTIYQKSPNTENVTNSATFKITENATFVTNSATFEKDKKKENVTNSDVDKGGICNTSNLSETPTFKLCKSCGEIILNPIKTQIFCGEAKVGEKAAHKCRNRDSNERNNTKRAINKILSKPLLFDTLEFIAPNKLRFMGEV